MPGTQQNQLRMNLRKSIEEKLLAEYSKEYTYKLANEIKGNQKATDALFEGMLSEEVKVAQRAAWVMRYAATEETLSTDTILKKSARLLPSPIHPGITRSILNILETRKISEKHSGKIWDLLFALLCDMKQDIAVHAIAVAVLHSVAKPFPELMKELESQLDLILEKNPSPALRSKKNNLFLKKKRSKKSN